jgi:vancomycin resistance protein YoaR
VAGALGGLVLFVGAAWALDTRAHQGKVLRDVALAGRPVGGMSRAELAAFVDDLAGRYDRANIEVQAPDGGFRARADELGVAVDRARTVAQAMTVGRRDSLPARLVGWARHLVTGDRRAHTVLQLDEQAVARVVAERDPARVLPTEPSIAEREGRLVGVEGRPGSQIDPVSLGLSLSGADLSRDPVLVTAGRAPIPPRFPVQEAERLAAEAEALANGGFKLKAGPQEVAVPAEVFRHWVKAMPAEDGLRLVAETAPIGDDLAKLFPKPVVPPADAGFAVNGASVVVTPAKSGSGCCGPGAVDLIAQAVTDPGRRPVTLPLREIPARRNEAAVRRLAIVERVATFTTSHAGGEPRVQNIHRMADLVRGTVIEPGQTFSINNTVGPRTRDKGFVEAPIIGPGTRFTDEVGGGVSQFATTLFNAAFFAGLEIPEYQMHGLYISRYPYGREATLSYPRPDLKVRNNSPYGVLVWPTYSGTSITVSLYSTKWVEEVTQSNQTTSEQGPCKVVTTERTRRWLDGRTAVDRFSGRYAPAEGVQCQ